MCAKYGAGFWKPGSGIIHQVVLEQYAFPGGMMIGTDSHTPNAGGMGMIAIGVGGADAVDVMTGFPWNVRWPKAIGVYLNGEMSGWTSAKDVILKVAEILTVKGGTGAIVEYFGPGARSLSATGKATICNMGAEIGATTSVFHYDDSIARYLKATDREAIADLAAANAHHLRADDEVEADPERFFDEVVRIDLSDLRPHINGPHSPDRARPLPALGEEARAEGWPLEPSAALIGSCTNSSYEDISRVASLARWASEQGLDSKVDLLITPGSEQVRATIERDGLLGDLEAIGARVLANACGPCIGQWGPARHGARDAEHDREQLQPQLPEAQRRQPEHAELRDVTRDRDGDRAGGHDRHRPVTHELTTPSGETVTMPEPVGAELPDAGFTPGESGFIAPADDGSSIDVVVRPDSDRLQVLTPFAGWNGADFTELPLLLKAQGKCTTDHISMAGPWLKYRGHLENISGNLFNGAVNAFTGAAGEGVNPVSGETQTFPDMAKDLHERGVRWVVVGDENYGEGSSREHAAMEPRFRGAAAVIVRSFARIHETNLKKQGVLPLTFADPADYDKIRADDKVSILGLADLAPNQPVTVALHHADGSVDQITTNHTMSPDQIAWFEAGSALNLIRERVGGQ